MFVQPLPQRHLDDAGGVVADDLLEVLQPDPRQDQTGHGHQGPEERGELRPLVDDPDDDDRGDGQPGDSGDDGQHANQGGQQDPPPDALGQSQ